MKYLKVFTCKNPWHIFHINSHDPLTSATSLSVRDIGSSPGNLMIGEGAAKVPKVARTWNRRARRTKCLRLKSVKKLILSGCRRSLDTDGSNSSAPCALEAPVCARTCVCVRVCFSLVFLHYCTQPIRSSRTGGLVDAHAQYSGAAWFPVARGQWNWSRQRVHRVTCSCAQTEADQMCKDENTKESPDVTRDLRQSHGFYSREF